MPKRLDARNDPLRQHFDDAFAIEVTVVVILIVFVQLVQSFGDWLVRRLSPSLSGRR